MVATGRLGRVTGRAEASGQSPPLRGQATLQPLTRVKLEQAPQRRARGTQLRDNNVIASLVGCVDSSVDRKIERRGPAGHIQVGARIERDSGDVGGAAPTQIR